MPSHHW